VEDLDLAFLVCVIILCLTYMPICTFFIFRPVIREAKMPNVRKQRRIFKLTQQTTFLGKKAKLLREELDELQKEYGSEYGDILDSAEQKYKLISELKKEAEDLKKLTSENEKLSEIIAKQKKTISALEMELKNKKNEE